MLPAFVIQDVLGVFEIYLITNDKLRPQVRRKWLLIEDWEDLNGLELYWEVGTLMGRLWGQQRWKLQCLLTKLGK